MRLNSKHHFYSAYTSPEFVVLDQCSFLPTGFCGNESIQLDSSGYQLESPGFPSDVATAVQCSWFITASPGTRVKIIVRIQENSDFFIIAIANVRSNDSNDIDYFLNYSGEVTPLEVMSSSHMVKVDLLVDSGTWLNTRLWLELRQVAAGKLARIYERHTLRLVNYAILFSWDSTLTLRARLEFLCFALFTLMW